MKSSLFSSKIITDPTLLFGTQLQFEYTNGLVENLADIYLIAKEKNQKQITVSCNYGLSEIEEKLIGVGFIKSLVSLELDLKSNNSKEVAFENNINCKQTGVSFLELKPLLLQQIEYHSKHYPEYYKNKDAIDFDEYQSVTTDDLNSINAHNLFIFKDNRIVGLILGEIKENNVTAYEFVVDEQYRNMGIGTQLLEQYLFLSKKVGVKKVILETWWNQPARKIYEKFGFVPNKQEFFITT